jgi:hypothetical protein
MEDILSCGISVPFFVYLVSLALPLTMLPLFLLDDEVLDDVYQWWTPPMRRLPPLLWKRLKEDLAGYLVEKGLGNVILVNWFHRQFKEAAANEYLNGEALYVLNFLATLTNKL